MLRAKTSQGARVEPVGSVVLSPEESHDGHLMAVTYMGLRATVMREEEHPAGYLWINVSGRLFFLGVAVRGMTRGDARRMARDFLIRLAERERTS